MKKIFGMILCALLVFTGCGGDDDSSSSPSLNSVTISGSSQVKPGETLELSATINTSGNPEGITYKWEVTDGATLSPNNETKTTLTAGANETSVTVTFTATYGETKKSDTKTITISSTAVVSDIVVTPGATVTTYGWADMANSGNGMKYPDTTNIIVIDDKTYTTAKEKCTAFTNAIASGSETNGTVNKTAAIIVLSGEVDLSVNTITDGYTVKTWFAEFDSSTHERKHEDIVYTIGSNKAIIGVNGAKLSHGGLMILGKSNSDSGENIIIRNVEFSDAHGSTEYDTSVTSYKEKKASADNLVIEAQNDNNGVYPVVPKNIWIDHCKFSDGDCKDMIRNYNHDGAFDMKAGQNVTVSWCEFTNHDKVTLLAPDDKFTSVEQRQITFHHIYYHETVQRTPRSRGCQLHLYNCYYDTIGFDGTDDNESGSNGGFMFGPGINSQYIVENCYLGSMVNSSAKKMKYFDTSSGGSSALTFSKFYQNGNSYTFTGSNDIATDGDTASSVSAHLTTTKPWTPGYSYDDTMWTYTDVQEKLPAAAGVDKEGYSKVIEVNGTTYSN